MIGSWWANTQYFNPKQVPGLVLWLDATDPAGNGIQPSSGTSIATWVDKSGQGNSPTQATSSRWPTFVTNQQNGLAVLTFSSAAFQCFRKTGISFSGNTTIFAAGTMTDGVNHTYIEYSDGASNTGCLLFNQTWRVSPDSGTNIFSVPDGGASYPATNVNVGVADGTDITYYVNSTSIGSTACGSIQSMNQLDIGGLAADTYFLEGEMFEVIVYNSALSSANRSIVTSYLVKKWGL